MNAGKAIQAAKEKDFVRGGVANMTEDAEILADQGRAIDPFEDFKFQTDITVADIRGGEQLTREASRPARVLLMGPAGQLFVQEETEDLETVDITIARRLPRSRRLEAASAAQGRSWRHDGRPARHGTGQDGRPRRSLAPLAIRASAIELKRIIPHRAGPMRHPDRMAV